MKIIIPDNVRHIIDTLAAAGYEAYAVGGCVRDSILGRVPDDWDITTSASPMDVKRLFKRTIDTGIQHGTVTVMINKSGYEITTYRIDGEYRDNRHPDSVVFTRNLSEDLKRRDFTINAMAYNDAVGIVDIFTGLSDIKNKIIRCVGNPSDRFSEDALRILRAFRFSAQLGFSIDNATALAASEGRKRLADISAERIRAELNKLLLSSNPDRLETLCEFGISSVILPEYDSIYNSPERKTRLFQALSVLPTAPHTLRWTVLLYSIDGNIDILKRLKFDNYTCDTVRRLLRFVDHPVTGLTDSQLRKTVSTIGIDIMEQLFEVKRSLFPETDFSSARIQFSDIVRTRTCVTISGLSVNGNDLINSGIPQGALIGQLLRMLLDEVIMQPELNTKEKLLELAANLYKDNTY